MENLVAADNNPLNDTPRMAETITLSEALNTHHDIAFGISGAEYLHILFMTFLLHCLNSIYLYNFRVIKEYVAHNICPNTIPNNIPCAPKFNFAINIILNTVVNSALRKLAIAYFLFYPNPLAICINSDENICATTFVAKKYLYLLFIIGDININMIKYIIIWIVTVKKLLEISY